MRRSSKPGDDVRDDDKGTISTRALRASVSQRQQGKYHRQSADNTSNKMQRSNTQMNPSYSMVPHHSGDIDCLPMPPIHPTPSTTPPTVPRLNLGGPLQPPGPAPKSTTPPIVPRLNLASALNGSPAAQTPPIVPKPTVPKLNKSSSVPTPSEDSPSELRRAQAEIQGLKCENMRLLLDKSSAHQRMQEVLQERDSLQAELARLKKEQSKASVEHQCVVAELAQCQQQLSEVSASSKVATTTSEIYTRNKSLQQQLEEKVQAEGKLGREKQELMGQLVQMKAALEEHATSKPDEQRSAVGSSAAPHDLPTALSLLQRRSVQNETLRQQKRDLEDELDGALAELQVLKDQIKFLEHKQLAKLQRQQQGRGKRMLGCALRCVARLGVYSAVTVATVAGTHTQQGRGLVDKLTTQGGRWAAKGLRKGN
ncbi:hypothetical protein DUNSADRAFT_1039 [Dunaliella salina]|uniref:Uncharacterized protein n=1 Tax=Dunaliella salina TaxID=3046 RepID=A0ABQ7GXM9_DUNSA|nr:hypothetical protein DUNSADRAFT_1039 [Dunaliella salina]|eukprot:KAF5839354.1 hypothetical protein DUNSADRAFT_1039 [Dunaliella salina]